MAVFKSEQYPSIVMHDGVSEWARFVGGRFESSDADVIKRLRAKGAADLGISEEKPAKTKSE